METPTFKTPGVRQRQIQRCCHCHKGVCEGGQLMSMRIRMTRLVANLGAIRQLAGLEIVLNPYLASVMGPDEELLKPLAEEVELFVCDRCALSMTVLELIEKQPQPVYGDAT